MSTKPHTEPCRLCKWEIPPGYLSVRGYCTNCEHTGYVEKNSRLVAAIMRLQNIHDMAKDYDRFNRN